jgi:hypothetical protein
MVLKVKVKSKSITILFFFCIITLYGRLSYANNVYECVSNYNEIFNEVKREGTYLPSRETNFICQNQNLAEIIKNSENKEKIIDCSSIVKTAFMNFSIDSCIDVLYQSNIISQVDEESYFNQYTSCINDNKDNINFIEFKSLKNCQNTYLLRKRKSEEKEIVDFCISYLKNDCGNPRNYQKAESIYNNYKDEFMYCYEHDRKFSCDNEQELRMIQRNFSNYKYCLRYDVEGDCKSSNTLSSIQNNQELPYNICRTLGINDDGCLNEDVLKLVQKPHTQEIGQQINFLASCVTNIQDNILCKQYIEDNIDNLILISNSTQCLSDETINQNRKDVCVLHLPPWYDKYKQGFSYCINKYDIKSAHHCSDHFLLATIQDDHSAFDLCLENLTDERCSDYKIIELINKYKTEFIECTNWAKEQNISEKFCLGLQRDIMLGYVLKNWSTNKYLMNKYCKKEEGIESRSEVTSCFHPSKHYVTKPKNFDILCPISCQTITKALSYCLQRPNPPNNISDCTSSLDKDGALLCIENHPMNFANFFNTYMGQNTPDVLGYSECIKKPFYYNFSHNPKKMVRCLKRIGYIEPYKRKNESLTQCVPSSLLNDTFLESIFPWNNDDIEMQDEIRDDERGSGSISLDTEIEMNGRPPTAPQ